MDCFMGSGTTAVATVEVGGGRQYIGYEQKAENIELAEERLKKAKEVIE